MAPKAVGKKRGLRNYINTRLKTLSTLASPIAHSLHRFEARSQPITLHQSRSSFASLISSTTISSDLHQIPPSDTLFQTTSVVLILSIPSQSSNATGQHLTAAAIIGHDGSVWAQSATFPRHAAVAVDEKLYVVGGSGNGRYLSDVQVFDLKSLVWSNLKLKPNVDKFEETSSLDILLAISGDNEINWGNKLFLIGGHSKKVADKITGVHPSIRGEVWEFLLGCYDPQSTFEEREQIRQCRSEEISDALIALLEWRHN